MSDSSNFLTYAQSAFESFDERPFCSVDSLVFAWLSYLRLPGDMPELIGWRWTKRQTRSRRAHP